MKPMDTKNPLCRGGSRYRRCFEHLANIIQAKTRCCKRVEFDYLTISAGMRWRKFFQQAHRIRIRSLLRPNAL